MKAFVGHSFEKKDSQIVDTIIKFLESAAIECETGEKAQNKSIAGKVKERILNNDIFVGIFTCDKEVVLENGSPKKQKFCTTSNWVVQESGFAIGSNKELIFLIENGVYKFPELQGDLEVIYFNRNSLQEPFLKLNQMIQSIRSKKVKGISTEIKEKPEDLENRESEKQKEEIQEKIKEKKQEAFHKLVDVIFKEEDYTRVREIYDEELQTILQEDEKPAWKAIILRWSHRLGDAKAFNELVKHAKENKNDPEVIWQLASRYKDMREYQKAKDQFLAIKELYDINKEDDKEKVIDCYEEASLCLAFDNKCDDAIELLSKLLSQDTLKEYKGKVLAGLANIAKISKDSAKFFVYAEGSLSIEPSNTELRFDLAYQYRQKGHNKLSLLHYKRLTDTKKSPAGLNNLGVQYETLKLPAKGIESYLEAARYKETLAMANIAQSYLNEGFTKDAEREIKRANELSKEGIEVHGNIGLAKNRLDKILEDEESKEREILIEAEKEREFRVKYSEAFYCDINVVKEKFEGIWETPWGDLRLIFDESTNSFKVDEKKKAKMDAFEAHFIYKSEPEKEHFKNRLIKIEGNVEKLSGKYKIEIEDIIEYQHIPPDRKKVYEASGYMVINEDYSTIDLMEKGKEEELNIHIWKKKKALKNK